MRILITGGEGLLGSRLCKALSDNHEVIAGDITLLDEERNYKVINLDITKKEDTEKIIEDIAPDIVVHAAALTDVDFSEKNHEKADLINVKGTENVVDACKKTGAKILYISTDFVFDGKEGPYDEEAVPNPINYYGKTKKQAEDIVKNSGLKYLIVRTTVLYGEHKNKISYVSWVMKQLTEGNKIDIVTDQYTTPTWAPDLANAIAFLIDKDYFKNGIIHAVSPKVMSRFDFTIMIADIFGLNKNLINPITTDKLKNPASRPKKGGMKTDKLSKLGYDMLTTEESLKRIKDGQDKI